MDEIQFTSLEQLYRRLSPALKSKKAEFSRIKADYIKEEDIFNCLKDTKWRKENDLCLYIMVDDILNTTIEEIIEYMKHKMMDLPRRKITGDDIL